MRDRLAIFHPPGLMALKQNPFGKDVANLQLWQALAQHGGYAQIDILSGRPPPAAETAAALFEGAGGGTQIATGGIGASRAPVEAGVLLRGTPELSDMAWTRRRRWGGDRAYSLVGMIHTLAPPAMRQILSQNTVAPIHPWDALICTSPSVRHGMLEMFGSWGAHLAERTGGHAPPMPNLPVIPLGVDGQGMAALADRPDARATLRASYGLGEDDVLVLWVGRLSYYEKAFPQPMFKAVQQAQAAAGRRAVLVMAGWFPDAGDRAHFEQAATAHAPDVDVVFADGNDRDLLGQLWAGADIFLSLVDNIQETFGLTPLEAMAAGLPLVVSDWDGYRFTVRDGIEGMLVPTLGGPTSGGLGAALVERHTIEGQSYQAYVGAVAQHTAVHIGRAAEALAALMRDPDLRRRMGVAGRARVADMLDWAVVARQIHALTDELAAIRTAAADVATRFMADPVKSDPFQAFAHFPTDRLTLETRLFATPGVSADAIRGAGAVALDTAFSFLRLPPELCAAAFERIAVEGGATVREVLTTFPKDQRRAAEMSLAWMAKCGFVDWRP